MQDPTNKIDVEEADREAAHLQDLAERQAIEDFYAELERREAEAFAEEEARMAAEYELWVSCYGEG